MAVFGQASDLAQTQFAFEQSHLLVSQKIMGNSSSQPRLAWPEALSRYPRPASLAIGQNVKAHQNLLKEFGTETTAVKDNCDSSFANQTAHLL
jgi:hypothetical protein